MEIIEDTITRNRKFKEENQRKLTRLKELKAPDVLIKRQELICNMTPAEYKMLLQAEEDMEKEEKAEYYKTHSMDKNVVDEIYKRVETLEYDWWKYESRLHFIMAIDPLKFMSNDDYHNDLYEPILTHAYEIYHNKFRKEFEADEESKNEKCI